MERIQRDSEKQVPQHLQEVTAAIAAVQEQQPGGKAGGASSTENPIFNDGASAALGAPAAASIFLDLHGDLARGKNGKPSAEKKEEKSQFVIKTSPKAQARSSYLPPTYMQMRAGAGGLTQHQVARGVAVNVQDLREGTGRSCMSLTGTTPSGGKAAVPIRGATVTPEMARGVGVGWLADELNTTLRVRDNPYENAPRRLEDDLRRGVDAAENLVSRRPDLLRNPNQQSPSAPRGNR